MQSSERFIEAFPNLQGQPFRLKHAEAAAFNWEINDFEEHKEMSWHLFNKHAVFI